MSLAVGLNVSGGRFLLVQHHVLLGTPVASPHHSRWLPVGLRAGHSPARPRTFSTAERRHCDHRQPPPQRAFGIILFTSERSERDTSGTHPNNGWKSPRIGDKHEFIEISGYKTNI